MIRSARVRAMLACFLLAACFTSFSYRLVRVQVSRHDEYTAIAAGKHVNKQVIHARRGTIHWKAAARKKSRLARHAAQALVAPQPQAA